MISLENALPMAPINVTALTLIFREIKAPAITANPVQMVCPKTPPMIIPSTSLIPAKTMVANNMKNSIRVKFSLQSSFLT